MRFATVEARLAAALAAEPDVTPERRAELELGVRTSSRTAVHYIDATFSAPKSWSVLHASLQAAGREDDATAVWDAWHAGVEAGLEYLRAEAGFSRAGFHGRNVAQRSTGRWVDAHAWTVAIFDHHTSRDGDPQLHTHAAILNRVRCDDGVWRTLDSRAVYAARPAAGALAERVAEEQLTRTLGVAFASRPDGVAREIVGIAPALRQLFSTRRRAITAGVAELAQAYQEKHGVPPSRYVLSLISQHVTLDSRQAKRSPEGRGELLSRWESQARAQLGASLAAVPDRTLGRDDAGAPVPFDPAEVAERAVVELQARKSVWSRSDLIQHLNRQLPDCLGGLPAGQVRSLLDQLADSALAGGRSAGDGSAQLAQLVGGLEGEVVRLTAPELVPTPAELRRPDGRSVFTPHDGDRFTTVAQLRREERLLAAATWRGAPVLSREQVAAGTAGLGLRGDQQVAVTGIATSGRRLDVLVGPAGTGKSYTMGALARLWTEQVGAPVVGLTVGQNAATVLEAEGVPQALNISRWLETQERLAVGHPRGDDENWMLRPGQLVIVDEASMAATGQLEAIRTLVNGVGGKLLLVGDDRQLDPVGAGGMFRLLATQPEPGVQPFRLEEVRRFDAEWERTASLQLRDGQPAALLAYDSRGRLVDGSAGHIAEQAVANATADLLAGRDSLLIAGSNAHAGELASHVRARLVAAGVVEENGTTTADGNRAGVGDMIQTRWNDWGQIAADGMPVINRHVYAVVERRDDGSLVVVRDPAAGDSRGWWWNPPITLTPAYLADHVTLAYATTKEAAQGRTVDTGHLVVDEHTSREGLYVELTRGRQSNHAYITTQTQADDTASPNHTDRFAVLTGILEADTGQRAATEVLREEQDAVDHLGRLGPIWTRLVEDDARTRYTRTLVDRLGPDRAAEVTADEAGGPLLRLLRQAELAGHDPAQVLDQAAGERSLDDARSVAEVLHHRISRPLDAGRATAHLERAGVELPADQLQDGPPAPRSFVERTPPIDGPVGDYTRQLAEVMDARASRLGDRAADQQPAWAVDQLGPLPADPLARAAWTRRAGQVAAYREQYGYTADRDPIGPAPAAGNPDARAAWDAAYTALGAPEHTRPVAARSDAELQADIDRYTREEAWAPPHVADQLRDTSIEARRWRTRAEQARAELTGPDVADSPDPADPQQAAGVDEPARRGELARRLTLFQRAAEDTDRDVAELEEIHTARTAWYQHTEAARQAARAARDELARRRPPQPDRPTAPPPAADQPETEPNAAQRARLGFPEPAAIDRSRALDAARRARETLADRGAEREQQELDDARRRGDDWHHQQHQPSRQPPQPQRDRSLGQ